MSDKELVDMEKLMRQIKKFGYWGNPEKAERYNRAIKKGYSEAFAIVFAEQGERK